MKIKKQLFYNILIFIVYYAFFSLSTIRFSNYDEIQYPTAISSFVLLTSIYIMLFINKRSLFFYTISAIVILLIGIISTEFSLQFFWGYFEDRLNFYIFQHLIFFVSCCFLLVLINKIFKKYSFVGEDEFIFIKGKNFISVLLLFVILIASIFRSIDQYTDFFRYYNSESQNESIVIDTAAVIVPVDGYNTDGNYETERNFEGEEEENITTYSFSSLWDNPADDERNIQNLIISLIDKILYTDGQGDLERINSNFNYFESRLMDQRQSEDSVNTQNYLIVRDEINRDPVKLKSAFNSYKYLFYSLMPKRIYSKTDLENLVNMLLLSYNDLNSKNAFQDMHTALNLSETYFEEMTTVNKYISEEYKTKFKAIYYGNGLRVRDEDLFWIYSFWTRRFRENNAKEVYDILAEIQDHYSE